MAYFLVNPPLCSWSFLSFTHLCLDTPFPTSFHRLFHIVFLPNLSHITSLHLCQLHFSASFPVILLIPPSPPPRHNFWLNGIQTVASCWMERLCWHRLSPALLLSLSLSHSHTHMRPSIYHWVMCKRGSKGALIPQHSKYTHICAHTHTHCAESYSFINRVTCCTSQFHTSLAVSGREGMNMPVFMHVRVYSQYVWLLFLFFWYMIVILSAQEHKCVYSYSRC